MLIIQTDRKEVVKTVKKTKNINLMKKKLRFFLHYQILM